MLNEILISIVFGLGILVQAILFIGNKFKREDVKEIIKNIGGGLIFAIIVVAAFSKTDGKVNPRDLYLLSTYCFFIGFGATFTLSFRKRILPRINEITLFALNILFLYYLVTRLGFAHFITITFYIPTFVALIILLLKKKLKNSQKGFLSIWYLILLIFVGFINIHYIMSASKNYLFSSYITAFFIGNIFLYLFVYIVYFIMFIPISNRDRTAIKRRRKEVKEHFLQLALSFNKLNFSPLLVFIVSLLLFGILLINYSNNYFSENIFIALIIFFTSFINAKYPIKSIKVG